jgi:hypothetical protein
VWICGTETRARRSNSPARPVQRQQATSPLRHGRPVNLPRLDGSATLDDGWTPARRRGGRRGHAAPPRPDGRHDRLSRHEANAHSRRPPTAARWAFHRATEGRCFKCLARDHRAASCRDPVRCLRCRRSGHRAAQCRATESRQFCAPPPPPPPPSPPPPPPPSTMAVGDPHERPEEETVFIPNSYGIARDARD